MERLVPARVELLLMGPAQVSEAAKSRAWGLVATYVEAAGLRRSAGLRGMRGHGRQGAPGAREVSAQFKRNAYRLVSRL